MAEEVNKELDGKAPISENYIQLGSRPPSSMLLQQKDQMSNGQKSLMSQLEKLNLSEDQL